MKKISGGLSPMIEQGDKVIILDNAPYYQGVSGVVSKYVNENHIEVTLESNYSNSLPKMFSSDELTLAGGGE